MAIWRTSSRVGCVEVLGGRRPRDAGEHQGRNDPCDAGRGIRRLFPVDLREVGGGERVRRLLELRRMVRQVEALQGEVREAERRVERRVGPGGALGVEEDRALAHQDVLRAHVAVHERDARRRAGSAMIASSGSRASGTAAAVRTR